VSGEIARLWVKRAHRGPMDAADSIKLIARRGIEGNADLGGRRQVTIIDLDRWHRLTASLGDIDPILRRANIAIVGVDLESTRGRSISLGPCVIEILGETRPCRSLDFAATGLMKALDPSWGGGVYGRVITGGVLTIGDAVKLR